MKGYVVYSTYDIIENQTVVQLFGRLETGESFMTINYVEPYFFIKKEDLKQAKKLLEKFKIEETTLKTFADEPVLKVSSPIHLDVNKLVSALHKKEIDTYEADVKPHTRFLIDNNILGSIEIHGDFDTSEKVNRIYKNPTVKYSDFIPELKIASIDIESNGSLYCIGIHSKNYQKEFMVTDKKLKNTVSCKNEEECLEKFKEELNKIDPDIITGWNIIDFDLVYLQNQFKKYKIPFDIGRTNDSPRLRIESNFFRSSSVDIPGRQVLDGLNLIKDPFIQEAPSIKHAEYDTFTLEEVSQSLLGETKLIKGNDRHEEITRLYKSHKTEDQQKLADYNLMDCKLAYDILIKTKIIDLAVERSQLTGMSLDKITASVAAFDSVYIREARKRGIVSPTTRFGNKEERIKGGYTFSSKAGIYQNVLILDFKSLYPSIIRTFNIDPASLLTKKEKGAIESPNKAYFQNKEGVLPMIIEKFHRAREKAKKEKRELASYAIKIIMNSFFGVLANPNCRYFSLDMANAITAFARMIIQLTAKKIEEKGFKVIYMDTDSCFVETDLPKEKAYALGTELSDYINNFYDTYVKENYNRKSFLELQFAKLYLSMMIPNIRGQKADEEEVAAKKRYAGLIEENGKEKIEITGLEAIRGDWTEAAKDFQMELLRRAFKKEPIEKFIQEYIKKLRAGKMDAKLIYRKSIRKNLDEYTKTTPPHVKAARLLDNLDSKVIQYYITVEGPEPIQKLTHKLDYDHYIKKQIEPIANQVLSLVNKSFEDIENGSKQSKLF